MQITLALIMLAVGLGCDAFSVAVCVGFSGATVKQKVRLASGFGAFQFLMPIAGLMVGHMFGGVAGDWAKYIGGAILIILGGIMIWRALGAEFTCPPFIHTSFIALVTASIGVSIDALAVGFGYGSGAKDSHIIPDSIFIGLVAFAMTILGAELGNQVGKLLQKHAPLLGGLILVALGARVIVGAM